MSSCKFTSGLVGALVRILAGSGAALGATLADYDEDAFKLAAGALAMESFETITWDSWIYHTRLPSPIPALDLDDDPGDPNDGPEYDLDGHFSITTHSTYGPADEQFMVIRDASSPPEVDGIQHLSFSPWYNGTLWPSLFDPDDQHPIVSFHDFHDSGASISAFGFYLHDYTPGEPWIVMEFDSGGLDIEYTGIDLSGSTGVTGSYFYGVITDAPFAQVQLHTNQNGGSIRLDEIYFSAIPEPGSLVLTALGLSALACYGRRRRGTPE